MTTLLEDISVTAQEGRAVPDAATGEPIGYVAARTRADLDDAVATARAAQPAWAALGHAERSRLLHASADEIDAHAEELAQIIAKEQGKPLNGLGARFEAAGCAAWIRAAADLPLEPEVIFEGEGTRSELHYVPLGVVGAISPWNWPALIAIWQIAPSLRMGNAVVAKPSEYTPLSVMAVAELMNRQLPPGVLTVVPGDREVGAAIAAHPGIDKIMFTGSTRTGREIVKSSAHNLARLTLELGGNDAGIVLPGADVKALGEKLFWGAFINSGQTCAALKRLYVHDSLYDEVVDELARLAEAAPLGPGMDERSALGPLSTRQQFDIVSGLVEDARDRGARIVTGGEAAPDLGAHFYRATIVADIDDDALLVSEEQFGPVLPIVRYTDLDDVIARANASDQALGASVWGDPEQARLIAERIQSGTVWINQHGTINPVVPFGGTKGSGYGLEFGVHGLKAVAGTKVITV
ncbi:MULTISPECIES: aldehyde dehydrogenase family protein [Microbacterium]|uniref:Aldehyde dehydrogenase family protein n=1 Tax=Microbacterium wangchenii TaxID=2541726 RepID=A0ABX5SRW4_9MICO|nr:MULTISPECIES: aldehyde dehydrogenase family protein [Microbacterium]MCK6066690.1 aldehyde dehydrogenase family protein [Microbacterium sp. EYE_512]QBR88017.1 aldehyde dehydrogenase family protein [Microbacterium wangchenii]TFV83865.1 aldehyde dehydrogenase family protein [Microbacterium sp. dk485]TXK18193.1 aldehyde dehydrogenase family protein [Microbacterium wangchenii]